MGAKKLKSAEPQSPFIVFLERHGRALLALFIAALVVHDIFGTHGFMAMYRTQNEIERVKRDLDRLNRENLDLGDQVRALKTDPRVIEKIAREDLQRARPGEIIIRIPQPPQPAPEPFRRP